MVSIYPDDIDILEKLAKTLTKLDKHTIAYEVYKKLLPISLHPDDVLYILANTAGIIMKPIESAMYAKMYLKNHPHNAEMLWIHAQDCIENGDRIQAIEILTKLVRLSPYN
jgi:tetratricopeptide (TPR) repeat protein